GAEPVSLEDELARVIPVVRGLAEATDIPLSIDTTKAEVARSALAAGATTVNDVSAGLVEPAILNTTAEADADLVLMHMLGSPRDMQVDPKYEDVAGEVIEHLRERVAIAWRAGVAIPKIQVDPGIGFGKRLEDNLALIRALPELRSLGRPILLGVSRKSFLGRLGGIDEPADRLTDTAAAITAGILLGAEILRVHAVEQLVPAIRVATALARND
ncbi:MAG: dihydropteroate synthase, partial [Planctomycetota bacterium]